MRSKIILFAGFVLMTFIAMGCMGPTRLETDYGTSHKLQKFNQISNPEAEKSLQAGEGLDGKAAEATKEKYNKGFEKSAPPPSYVFTIEGIGGAGTAAQK